MATVGQVAHCRVARSVPGGARQRGEKKSVADLQASRRLFTLVLAPATKGARADLPYSWPKRLAVGVGKPHQELTAAHTT